MSGGLVIPEPRKLTKEQAADEIVEAIAEYLAPYEEFEGVAEELELHRHRLAYEVIQPILEAYREGLQ